MPTRIVTNPQGQTFIQVYSTLTYEEMQERSSQRIRNQKEKAMEELKDVDLIYECIATFQEMRAKFRKGTPEFQLYVDWERDLLHEQWREDNEGGTQ